MILETRAAPPFMKNGFVIGCEERGKGIVIDPGDDVEELARRRRGTHRLDVRYILLTHAHLDHITGVGRAKAALGVPVVLHRDDNFLYEAVVQQGRRSAFASSRSRRSTVLRWRRTLDVRQYAAWVHHTPGHCPGGVCLAVGRLDSARADLVRRRHAVRREHRPYGPARRRPADTAERPIREVLFSFPDETAVYSGHGEPTTIGRERRTNRFLNETVVVRRSRRDASGSSSTTNSTLPTPRRSPVLSTARSTRAPLTNVPFVLSRSTTSSSAAPAVSRQCRRDTSAASTHEVGARRAADGLDGCRAGCGT